MARPRADAHDVPTRTRILQAAHAAFAAQGYEAARLADVAAAAGIRRPSLLYHFGSKDELYAQVVRDAFAALRDALAAAIDAPGPFRARVEALVAAYLRFLDADPHFAPLLLRELVDGQGPGRELVRAHVVPLLDLLEAFLEGEGRGALRPGLPARAAVLQIATAALVRSSAGPLREPLWGSDPPERELALKLLLTDG